MLCEQPPFREHGYASRVECLAITRCNRSTWNPSGQSAHGAFHGLPLTILVAYRDFWLARSWVSARASILITSPSSFTALADFLGLNGLKKDAPR